LALAVVLGLATAAAAPDEAADDAPPSFRAGAEVTLGCTVRAPEDWVINPGIPFRVTLDPAQLKTAPYSLVGKPQQDFKLKDYDNRIYFELVVKLHKDLPDGQVKVPLKFDCGVCMADQSQCSFTEGQTEAAVTVQNSAAAGSKTQALKSGTQPVEYRLPLPQ
jgi:hypothetical protein